MPEKCLEKLSYLTQITHELSKMNQISTFFIRKWLKNAPSFFELGEVG